MKTYRPGGSSSRGDGFKVSSLFSLVCLIVIVGYGLIFVSIFGNKASTYPTDFSHINLEKQRLEREAKVKDKLLLELQSKLDSSKSKINGYLNQPPTPAPTPKAINVHDVKSVVQGVIVLGMHRSGTSILGGLMNKMGLATGGPLIEAGEDNEKGFFERIDVVLQNDYLMKKQGIHYAYRCNNYDALKGTKDILNDDGSFFKEGKRALAFLNQPKNYPWMLKDPRLCITLRTWLSILSFIPAIVFTYRHPMDVAMSLFKRYEHYPIGKGLRMWYVYNKRAIVQSGDLCRVVTSHNKIMKSTREELDRIYSKLLYECGVPVPHKVSSKDMNDFVDPTLQHGKTGSKDALDCKDAVALEKILPPSSWETKDENHFKLYRSAMKLYCAMETGLAFKLGFHFDDSIVDE